MRVFISSLITGMEEIRAAARSAVTTLGHEPVMAEDFGALPHSPQVACLDGVRRSGATVLILGSRYRAKQASRLSATHEEYREARERCPVLVFVEEGLVPDHDQALFIAEVQGWKTGLIRAGFADPADLQAKLTMALHRMELATAAAPFNAGEVLARAVASFPSDRGRSHYGDAILLVSVAGGPAQAVLRPSRLEDPALAEEFEREALFGSARIFRRREGTSTNIVDGKLVLEQGNRCPHSLHLDAQGGMLITQSVENAREMSHGMSVILVETVQERLMGALRYAAWLLDHIDATQRLAHVVVATQITGGFAMRTRREHEASPNSWQRT